MVPATINQLPSVADDAQTSMTGYEWITKARAAIRPFPWPVGCRVRVASADADADCALCTVHPASGACKMRGRTFVLVEPSSIPCNRDIMYKQA